MRRIRMELISLGVKCWIRGRSDWYIACKKR